MVKTKTNKISLTWLLIITAGLLTAGAVIAFSAMSRNLGPEYRYDIEQYSRIDPALIVYQQIGQTIHAEFDESRAIAVSADGTIYVAGDQKIVALNQGEVSEFDLPQDPTALHFDQDGTLIVALTNRLVFLDAEGAFVQQWSAPADSALLTSIASDAENVYAADAIHKCVWRFDRQGLVINKIGVKETRRNIPGLVVPSPYLDIAMYPDGLLRVVNPGRHLVEAYTPRGDREWVWGKTSLKVDGFSGCCNPVSMAVLPDGGFVTSEKGLPRVKVHDADGEFAGVVAGPDQLGLSATQTGTGKLAIFDVAVDSAGRVYVLDTLNNVIRIFEKT
jgi:DNA-binding beta-propeller fold protein YncE